MEKRSHKMARKKAIKPEKIPAGMKLRHTLRGHSGVIRGLAWSPDGVWLASASNDKTVRIWNTGTGELYKTLAGHQDWVHSVSWSTDGQILASGSRDTTICLWDGKKGRLLNTIKKHKDTVLSLSSSFAITGHPGRRRFNHPHLGIGLPCAAGIKNKLPGTFTAPSLSLLTGLFRGVERLFLWNGKAKMFFQFGNAT